MILVISNLNIFMTLERACGSQEFRDGIQGSDFHLPPYNCHSPLVRAAMVAATKRATELDTILELTSSIVGGRISMEKRLLEFSSSDDPLDQVEARELGRAVADSKLETDVVLGFEVPELMAVSTEIITSEMARAAQGTTEGLNSVPHVADACMVCPNFRFHGKAMPDVPDGVMTLTRYASRANWRATLPNID